MEYRKLLIYTFLLLSFCKITAQDIMWEKSFGGRHAEYLSDIQPTADYGFILGGSSLSEKSGNKNTANKGDLDFWIWKMDEHGEPEWQKNFGGNETDILKCIKNTKDGGFILAGNSSSSIGFDKKEDCRGGSDYWIIKIDAGKEEIWQRTFGGKGQEDLTSIICTLDGGYLIGGSSNSDFSKEPNSLNEKKENSRGGMDYWIIKLDSNGKEEWQKTYGGCYNDLLKSMASTKDGGYIIGGNSNSTNSGEKADVNFGIGSDYWIIKIDAYGSIIWEKTIGGDKDDQLEVVINTKDRGFLIGGSSLSGASMSKDCTNGKGSDFWIVKFDEDGSIIWQETYDFGFDDVLTSITENADQSYLIGGYTVTKDGEKSGDYIGLKISEKGDQLWDYVVGSDGEDILQKLIETRDGGYILAGTANPETKIKRKKGSNNRINGNPLDSQKQLAVVDQAQEEIDKKVNELRADLNNSATEQMNTATDKINDKISNANDSNYKVGLNTPIANLLNPSANGGNNTSLADSFGKAMEAKGPKPGAKFSREKKMNFGSKDYWVVKIKDKEKKIVEKVKIEAIPNPTSAFTNVIIGFDFDSGSATVYDLSGRLLQEVAVDSRTVPVNLSSLPSGIYIINVKTNKGEGSVKIIKE